MFVDKYKTDRLQKGLKIYTTSKAGLLNEIFQEPIHTEYVIETELPKMMVSFHTSKDFKYRIDIFGILEIDKSSNEINHIAFSDYANDINDEDKYEELLDRGEMIEIINRIHFILKDLMNKNKINNYFCIGGTKLLSKNNIYNYALKIIVGDDGFDKLTTNIYKTKFGLYFKI
jgi:hypothetical protein